MKKKIKLIAILCVSLFVLWNLIAFFVGRTSSEMVYYDTLEESFGATLYLFKDEIVIGAAEDGVLRPTAKDGERVSKGARVGAVLSADTDEGALHEYLRIGDRIKRLSQTDADEGYSATVRTDEQITSLSLQITAAAEKGDMLRLGRLKDELLIAKDEKSALGGERETLIRVLKDRQTALQSGIGNSIKEIYSPEAGTLLLHTDGMESVMTAQNAKDLTPGKLAELTASAAVNGSGCKILYHDTWKAACTVSAEEAGKLNVGQAISLRFHDCGGAVEKATVTEISEEEDGKRVIVFSSNRTVEGLLSCRKLAVDVIIKRHKGLRVPEKAITEENGVTGVYVQTVTDRVFRETEVSYIGNGYAIIQEGQNTKLKLYDTVIY